MIGLILPAAISANAIVKGWLESIRTKGGAPSLSCLARFAARLDSTNLPCSNSLRISGEGSIRGRFRSEPHIIQQISGIGSVLDLVRHRADTNNSGGTGNLLHRSDK